MRSEWTLSGKEAVLRARQSMELGDAFHAYIIDWRLPDMNGYEATKQIRALNDPALAGITILAMTANAFDEDRKKALECGMDGFLSKPIVIEELITMLQKNLNQASAVSEKTYYAKAGRDD